MAYIYEVSLAIPPDAMEELRIGSSVERVLGYLKTLLPSQEGFINVRVMFTTDPGEDISVVVQSEWERWRDLATHQESSLAEDKVVKEFAPHIELGDLKVTVYQEVD